MKVKLSGGESKSSPGLHPRNRHQGHYDFEKLILATPELAPFVHKSPRNELTIDFSKPEAVKTLNRALLKTYYGLLSWEIPSGFLCPPIPGRADYIHFLADLLSDAHGSIPRGDSVHVLDIGVGANCIYPILGRCEYGWRFTGSDTDLVVLKAARKTVESNSQLKGAVELKQQTSLLAVFKGIIQPQDQFDLVLCNPPFHASLEEAQQGSLRKWKNLGKVSAKSQQKPLLNFGGQGSELWCPGGEAGFIDRMITESVAYRSQVLWFTSLISKEATLPGVTRALNKVRALDWKMIEMAQGQKKSRFVCWTFLDSTEQAQWRAERWSSSSSSS